MVLEQIEKFLEKEQFDCSLVNSSEDVPYDRLLVFLGLDYEKREQILEIIAQEQLTDPLVKSSPEESYYRIQFQIPLSFKVEDLALNQVASLILFLNQLVDFPGLELHELNNQVIYRYVWLTKGSGIDSKLIISITGIIMLLLELFTASIERLALGKSTFNELLEEVIKIAKSHKK